MDEARVSDRLDRIDVLGRRGASPAELLAELRGLVQEVEAPAPGVGEGEEVVERRRMAPHGT
jgi:hypothetical protein